MIVGIDGEKETMTDSCCMCGTTKFVGRVNTGSKFYCNKCMKKINDSEMDYWKPCTQSEFFESMLEHIKKDKDNGPPNMFKNIRKTLQENDRVEFTVSQGKKGWQANDVVIIGKDQE